MCELWAHVWVDSVIRKRVLPGVRSYHACRMYCARTGNGYGTVNGHLMNMQSSGIFRFAAAGRNSSHPLMMCVPSRWGIDDRCVCLHV